MAEKPRRRSTLLPLALLIGAATASALLLLFAPEWIVGLHGLDDQLKPPERAKQVTEERRSILALLAALGAAIGIYYTHLRHKLERDSGQLSRDSNFTDRYTKAVEQLGHDSPDVQLGGIYALERIALDSERDRGVIKEVLSALIRERAVTPPINSAGGTLDRLGFKLRQLLDSSGQAVGVRKNGAIALKRVTTVVQAALTVLARWPIEPRKLDLLEKGSSPRDFVEAFVQDAGPRGSGPDLTGAYLPGADLTFAHFNTAVLVDVDLSGADLSYADLSFSNLRGANLTEAILVGADLTNANLTNATLTNAIVAEAKFSGTDVADADLTGADLTDEQRIGTFSSRTG